MRSSAGAFFPKTYIAQRAALLASHLNIRSHSDEWSCNKRVGCVDLVVLDQKLKNAAVENGFSRFLFHLSWLLSGRLVSQGNIMALVLRFLPILLVIAVLLLFFRRSRGKKMPFPAAQGGNGKLFLTLGATLVAFVLFVMGAELITRL